MSDADSNHPQLPFRFLQWFCPRELREEIEGDLVQKYRRDKIHFGERRAKLRLVWNTIRFCRPGIILRNKFTIDITQAPMLRNYFKTAFRFFARHKTLSGINLFGLATGMCVSFLALLYVNFELSYDTYHAQADNITLAMTRGYTTFLTLTLSSEDLHGTLNSVARKWKELLPDTPFMYFFTDDAVAAQYKNDERFGKLAAWFAAVAVLVSCLGLLGLSAFSAAQRTREIGIRKILGAPVSRIIGLLTKDFMILVVIAFGIGAPLAWFGVNQWLEGFAYRVDVSWWVFLLTGFSMVVVAFLTISFNAARAAVVNPVDSLKTE